jgi:hypothetical protein
MVASPKDAKTTVKGKKVEATVLPELRDGEGNLLKLKGSQFPKTKEGKQLFCDYQIARWQDRKVRLEKAMDPAAKKVAKMERLRKQLAILEEEAKKEREAAAAAAKK